MFDLEMCDLSDYNIWIMSVFNWYNIGSEHKVVRSCSIGFSTATTEADQTEHENQEPDSPCPPKLRCILSIVS